MAAPTLYVADQSDNTLTAVDTGTDTIIGSPCSLNGKPFWLTITPDSSKVLLQTNGPTIDVVDTATMTLLNGSGFPIGEGFVAASNSTGYVFDSANNQYIIFDITTGSSSTVSFAMNTQVCPARQSPDGSIVYFVVNNIGTSLEVWTLDTGTNATAMLVDLFPYFTTFFGGPFAGTQDFCVSPDGTMVYVTAYGSGATAAIAPVTSGGSVGSVYGVTGSPAFTPISITTTPDGLTLWVGAAESLVTDLVSGVQGPVLTDPGAIGNPNSLAATSSSVYITDNVAVQVITGGSYGTPITLGTDPGLCILGGGGPPPVLLLGNWANNNWSHWNWGITPNP